jgi:hypothetical protein
MFDNLIRAGIVLMMLAMLTCGGCAALKDKAVVIATDSKVGKLTMTDPSGSGNPMPQIVVGAMTGTWADCPAGSSLESLQVSYKLFQNEPSTIQYIKIDATKSGALTPPVLDALFEAGYLDEGTRDEIKAKLAEPQE